MRQQRSSHTEFTKNTQKQVTTFKTNNPLSTQSFYPNIGTLITIDDFPPELRFLQNGLQTALDNIYYKDLPVDRFCLE